MNALGSTSRVQSAADPVSRAPSRYSRDDVCLITIAYNSAQALRGLLQTCPRDVPVIVVDNASEDDSARVAQANGADVIRLARNVGFGAACNVGAARARSRLLLFVNPDVRLGDGAIERLCARFAALEDAGAVAPLLDHGDGRLWTKCANFIDIAHGCAPASQDDAPTCLSGSVFLIERDTFAALGGFDPNLFLYYEEDDLFHRLCQKGLRLAIADDVVMAHAHGGSSGMSLATQWLKSYHTLKSKIYISKKYGLPFNAGKEVRRVVLRALSGIVTLSPKRLVVAAARGRVLLSYAFGQLMFAPVKIEVLEPGTPRTGARPQGSSGRPACA
ncbi:MAG: glycosyltransferase family 2 protein [Geminicoccaceae bacterium]